MQRPNKNGCLFPARAPLPCDINIETGGPGGSWAAACNNREVGVFILRTGIDHGIHPSQHEAPEATSRYCEAGGTDFYTARGDGLSAGHCCRSETPEALQALPRGWGKILSKRNAVVVSRRDIAAGVEAPEELQPLL